MEQKEKIQLLADAMIKMLSTDDMEAFHQRSYEIAEQYLTEKIEQRWKEVVR